MTKPSIEKTDLIVNDKELSSFRNKKVVIVHQLLPELTKRKYSSSKYDWKI